MKAKRIISLLVSLSFIFTMPMLAVSKCSALDMTHDYYEELELLENKLVYKPCWGHEKDDCEKYLFRYEQFPALIERFKEIIKENNYKNTKEVVQKIGIGMTSLAGAGIGFYFCPIPTIATTIITTLGLSTICAVHKKIIEQSGEAIAIIALPGLSGIKACVVAFLAKQVIKLKNWVFGDKPIVNVDKGLVGNTLNILCGDATKENQNYGVIVLSTDFTDLDLDNVKGAIVFSKTNIDLNYDEPLEKYFKNI